MRTDWHSYQKLTIRCISRRWQLLHLRLIALLEVGGVDLKLLTTIITGMPDKLTIIIRAARTKNANTTDRNISMMVFIRAGRTLFSRQIANKVFPVIKVHVILFTGHHIPKLTDRITSGVNYISMGRNCHSDHKDNGKSQRENLTYSLFQD